MTPLIEKQIELGRWLVGAGLVNKFYYGAELFTKENGVQYPVYRKGDEMFFIGPDDTKGRFGYARLNGAMSFFSTFSPGSCDKGYLIDTPVRVVIFSDREAENFDRLTTRIMGFTFLQNVRFTRAQLNPAVLARDESPIGDFKFGGTTFYLSVDVVIRTTLTREACAEDNCIVYPNPIC